MATNEATTEQDTNTQLVTKARNIRAVADLVLMCAETHKTDMPEILRGTLPSAMSLIVDESEALEELI